MSEPTSPDLSPNVTIVEPEAPATNIDDVIGAPEVAMTNQPAPVTENEIPAIEDTVPNTPQQAPAPAPEPAAAPAPEVTQPPVTEAEPKLEEQSPSIPEPFQQKATQQFDYVSPIPADSNGEEDVLELPPAFPDLVQAAFVNSKNQEYQDNPDGRMWINTVTASMRMGHYKSVYKKTVENPEAEFVQAIDYNGSKLMGGSPRFNRITGETLKGEKAVLRLRKQAGIGVPFQIPLWHSGFYLTLKSPTDSDLINLNYLMTSDKIDFGRYTYGLSLSNTMAYTVRRLLDFAMDHIYDCSLDLKNIPESGLLNLIHQQDIQSIVWGILCTMYPNNLKFDRPCVSNPDTCNYVEHAMLNPRVLQRVNKKVFSNWQLNHMTKRASGSMTLDDVRRYQGELRENQKRTFVLTEGANGDEPIKLTLKSATAAEHVDAGFRWLSEIAEAVERVVQKDAEINDRNALMKQYAQSTMMRQYTHLVDSIDPGNNNIIQDPETIEKALSDFSTESRIREKFIEECVDYIETSTICLIGITAYTCPSCKQKQDYEKVPSDFVNIIPLDVINLFFNLFDQRVTKISQR
jgi:hypothetical protein